MKLIVGRRGEKTLRNLNSTTVVKLRSMEKYRQEKLKGIEESSSGMTRRRFLNILGAGIALASLGKLAEIVLASGNETWDSSFAFLNSSRWRDIERGEYTQREWEGFGMSAEWEEVVNLPIGRERTPLLKRKPIFREAEKNVEYAFENLKLRGGIGRNAIDNHIGIVQRALRYQSLTSLIEAKYNLPKNLLLAILIQESQGGGILLNGTDDGGAGIIHFQPSVAQEFNLKVYKGVNDLINRKHGEELRELVKEEKGDLVKLSKYDDRFNPLINIDATARKILLSMHSPNVEDGYLRFGVRAFSGRGEYWGKLKKWILLLDEEVFIRKVEEVFNRDNENLLINGEKPENPFLAYLVAFTEMNWKNYGVDYYVEKNKTAFTSERLQASYGTYRKFLNA